MSEQGVTGPMLKISDRYANVPPSWASAGIADARAFRVGNSDVVHTPSHVRPNLVRGKCGITAHVVERDSRLATWADAYPTCPTCST